RQLAGIAGLADVAVDHLGVPDTIGQHRVDLRLEGIELAGPLLRPAGRFTVTLECAVYGLGVDPQFMSNVLDVSALAPSLSYHQIVLSGQHPRSPSGQTCKTECRWSEGASQIAEKGTLQGVANRNA